MQETIVLQLRSVLSTGPGQSPGSRQTRAPSDRADRSGPSPSHALPVVMPSPRVGSGSMLPPPHTPRGGPAAGTAGAGGQTPRDGNPTRERKATADKETPASILAKIQLGAEDPLLNLAQDDAEWMQVSVTHAHTRARTFSFAFVCLCRSSLRRG